MTDVLGWVVAVTLVVAIWGAAFLFGADTRDGRDWRSHPRDGGRWS